MILRKEQAAVAGSTNAAAAPGGKGEKEAKEKDKDKEVKKKVNELKEKKKELEKQQKVNFKISVKKLQICDKSHVKNKFSKEFRGPVSKHIHQKICTSVITKFVKVKIFSNLPHHKGFFPL